MIFSKILTKEIIEETFRCYDNPYVMIKSEIKLYSLSDQEKTELKF